MYHTQNTVCMLVFTAIIHRMSCFFFSILLVSYVEQGCYMQVITMQVITIQN